MTFNYNNFKNPLCKVNAKNEIVILIWEMNSSGKSAGDEYILELFNLVEKIEGE